MIPLLALFLAQVGLPFSMLAGGAGPTATPTVTPTVSPTPNPTQVAIPSISPAVGNTPVTVTITCATSGATIFYTVSNGGTNPTHSGATPSGSTLVYSSPFSTGPGGSRIVKALGYKSGLSDSAIATRTYEQAGNQ